MGQESEGLKAEDPKERAAQCLVAARAMLPAATNNKTSQGYSLVNTTTWSCEPSPSHSTSSTPRVNVAEESPTPNTIMLAETAKARRNQAVIAAVEKRLEEAGSVDRDAYDLIQARVVEQEALKKLKHSMDRDGTHNEDDMKSWMQAKEQLSRIGRRIERKQRHCLETIDEQREEQVKNVKGRSRGRSLVRRARF